MTFKPPKPQKPPEPRGDVEVGDHLYVHHLGQPCTGVVCSHGRHGVTVDIEGQHHKVRWDRVLGHKRRTPQRYDVVDHGEDGMLVQDAGGRRRFISITNDSKEDPMVAKSLGRQRPVLLFAKSGPPPGPGLTEKKITDKNGVQTTRWVSIDQGGPPAQRGQHIGFQNGEHHGHGQVSATGQHGVTVRDQKGGEHRVLHDKITHHWQGDGAPDHSPHEAQAESKPQKPAVKPHEGNPDTFNAADFASQHDDKEATADSIIDGFGPEARQKIAAAGKRVGGVTQTIHEHTDEKGNWNEKRAALHRKLMFDGVEIDGKKVPGLLSPDRIKAATPAAGQAPTFIALGGRGGSGKSSLKGRVYEESRAIVLDADHIKGMLPEYSGWNAHQVHEESSHVLETVLSMAKILGVNVVLDATMKTSKSIESKVDDFKASGFRIEAHYMHLPRQEAAKRAIGRFLDGGENGRYVPPEVVLGNTHNEKNFDAIKNKADAWSFHDNSGEKGSGPKLIASKGEPSTVAKKIMVKSFHGLNRNSKRRILTIWKVSSI